jgi:hypothetical protein
LFISKQVFYLWFLLILIPFTLLLPLDYIMISILFLYSYLLFDQFLSLLLCKYESFLMFNTSPKLQKDWSQLAGYLGSRTKGIFTVGTLLIVLSKQSIIVWFIIIFFITRRSLPAPISSWRFALVGIFWRLGISSSHILKISISIKYSRDFWRFYWYITI